MIADRVRAGASLRAIGRELGRPASTISREVARNRDQAGLIGRRPGGELRAGAPPSVCLVAVQLVGGRVQAKVSAGSARILMDVSGYYRPAGP